MPLDKFVWTWIKVFHFLVKHLSEEIESAQRCFNWGAPDHFRRDDDFRFGAFFAADSCGVGGVSSIRFMTARAASSESRAGF